MLIRALFATIAALGLAACDTTTNTPMATEPAATAAPEVATVTASAVPEAKPAPALAAVQLNDGTYQAESMGNTATIVVRNGAPVSYTWGSYIGKRVSLDSNTIKVDQATYVLESIGQNSLSGIWTLGRESFPLTLVRQS